MMVGYSTKAHTTSGKGEASEHVWAVREGATGLRHVSLRKGNSTRGLEAVCLLSGVTLAKQLLHAVASLLQNTRHHSVPYGKNLLPNIFFCDYVLLAMRGTSPAMAAKMRKIEQPPT